MELPGKRELREQILHQMDGRTSYVSDKDVYREIDKAILRSSHGGYGTLSEKEELRRQMFYSIRGFDVLEKYLGDSSISEIILKRTMQHLKYKMDTEEEIRVLLSGKLFEKNIMLSMPFFILLYLRLANPKYVECFYNTILGHLVMSGMIGITVFCFFWSEKIMNIRF